MATALAQEATPSLAVPIPQTQEEVQVPIGEGESLFPPFDAEAWPSHLLWIVISFGLLYIFVKRVVVPRVGGILEDRRDRIASDRGEASRLARETDGVISAYEAELAAARQKAYSIAQARRDEIKSELAAKQSETEAELNKKIADAEVQIAARRDAALADVDEIAAQASQAIVEQLTGMSLSSDDALSAVRKAEAGNA